jgi:hypothetical protein
LGTAAMVNPSLYALEKSGTIVKLDTRPPTWEIKPNTAGDTSLNKPITVFKADNPNYDNVSYHVRSRSDKPKWRSQNNSKHSDNLNGHDLKLDNTESNTTSSSTDSDNVSIASDVSNTDIKPIIYSKNKFNNRESNNTTESRIPVVYQPDGKITVKRPMPLPDNSLREFKATVTSKLNNPENNSVYINKIPDELRNMVFQFLVSQEEPVDVKHITNHLSYDNIVVSHVTSILYDLMSVDLICRLPSTPQLWYVPKCYSKDLLILDITESLELANLENLLLIKHLIKNSL